MFASIAPVDLWCGSYTADAQGAGLGIGMIRSESSGELTWLGIATHVPSPSFVAQHPALPVIYAVGEADGLVYAYCMKGARENTDEVGLVRPVAKPGLVRLQALGEPWNAGEAACHVAVDPAGRFITVTCWGNGSILLYELDAVGAMTARFPAEPAADPHGDSGRPSRAHATLVLPDGRLATTDIGFDVLRIWRYEPGIGLVSDHEVVLPFGSGPRHLALHPSGHVYVVSEYSIEVFVLEADAVGHYVLANTVPATAEGARPGDAAAEISIDESGQFVYVSVRSSNRISTLSVHAGGGRLEPVADVSCAGDGPRHHLQLGDRLHVANQRSNSVASFRLDPESGVPVELLGIIDVGSPTCLAPASLS